MAAETGTKEKIAYQDAFQKNLGDRLESVGHSLEGKGRTILYGISALAILGIAFGIFYVWNSRADATAQTELGKAIETANAQVTSIPPPAGTTAKTFATEKDRAEAAIAEFQAVADKFGGDVGEKAKYFLAVNRLVIDRPAGIAELEAVAKSSDEVGTMAKFALAQAKAGEGKNDEALALYQELAAMDNPIISKDTINFELAGLLEKAGKKQEAADLYFTIAKTASEAKEPDGTSIPMDQTARNAKDKLQGLAPDRAKEIVDSTVTTTISGDSDAPTTIYR